MPSLLEVCPQGVWVSEDQAVEILGLSSKSALKDSFTAGSLPHVYVDHGKRYDHVPEPYHKHRFFFVQKEGTTCTSPSINLVSWISLCQSLEGEKINNPSQETKQLIKEYTNYSSFENAVKDLKSANGILTADELSKLSTDDDAAYRYGSNGGKVLAPSKASSFRNSSQRSEAEVYTRADGKKVRRIKKSSSASGASLQASPTKKTLSGFLSQDDSGNGESKLARLGGSRSVAGGEGEIYVRADGKKGEYSPYIF
jgi:hypothetical protein